MSRAGFATRIGVGAALGASVLAMVALAPMDDQQQTITLTIDFANGFEMRYSALEVDADATVLDVMLAARDHERPLAFAYKGEGHSAFLMSIEDVENELAGPKSKNWLYWVNDEFAKAGMGQQAVQDGDAIRWRFGQWKDGGP